jgi:hypothetical protein
MLRAFSIFGLGGIFLVVSPELRGSVMDEIQALGVFLNNHSPLSYLCVGAAALGGAMFWVYRAAQPR